MAEFYRRLFPKKKSVEEIQNGVYKFELEEYDNTYKIPLSVLKFVGLRLRCKDSACARFWWDAFYWVEFINLFIAVVLELINMIQTGRGGSFQDAVDIFRMLPCMGYVLLAMLKSCKIENCRPVYENLYSELRDMWPRGEVSKEEYDIISTRLKLLHYSLKGYYGSNNCLVVLFLIPPYLGYIKYSMGQDATLGLPFFFWFPFDPYQRGYYEFLLVLQSWHGLLTVWFIVSSDSLFCVYLSHITTNLDLLALKIRRFVYVKVDNQLIKDYPLGAYSEQFTKNNMTSIDLNSKEGEEKKQKELTEIVLRHRALIRLAGDIESLFSFSLLLNFLNSSIIICFTGFCCIVVEKWNEIIYKSFLTTALLQTWLLCWYGQRLIDSSLGVADALYNCGWYRVSKKIRSMILIMLHRSLKEVHVTTYGFSVISLKSYGTIVKTSWSYFTLLLKFNKDEI